MPADRGPPTHVGGINSQRCLSVPPGMLKLQQDFLPRALTRFPLEKPRVQHSATCPLAAVATVARLGATTLRARTLHGHLAVPLGLLPAPVLTLLHDDPDVHRSPAQRRRPAAPPAARQCLRLWRRTLTLPEPNAVRARRVEHRRERPSIRQLPLVLLLLLLQKMVTMMKSM